MSYINADDVLPNILVKEIQKYVDGQLIYIPRKNENLLSWGEKIGICPSGFFSFRLLEKGRLYRESSSVQC